MIKCRSLGSIADSELGNGAQKLPTRDHNISASLESEVFGLKYYILRVSVMQASLSFPQPVIPA